MNHRQKILLKAYKLFDLLTVVFSFLLAASVSYHHGRIPFIQFMESRIKVTNVVVFFGFLLIWHLIFSGFGLYDSRRLSTRYDDVVDVLRATSPCVLSFVNAHAANLLWLDAQFRDHINSSDVVVRDGVGMYLLRRLLGREAGVNLNGTDLIPELLIRTH